MVIERPQASSLLYVGRTCAGSEIPARHIAPVVESGDMSTRCAPTFIDEATLNGSPPRRATSPGTVGRNAGRTTADVLLYTEISPVTNAITPVNVPDVASLASKSVKRSRPPVLSSSATRTLTPLSMRIGFQGILRIACS